MDNQPKKYKFNRHRIDELSCNSIPSWGKSKSDYHYTEKTFKEDLFYIELNHQRG